MTLALDANHDLHLGPRQGIAIARDGDQSAQGVITRLQLLLGEFYLDRSAGTPWFEQVLTDNPDIRLIETTLKERILDAPDVTGLLSFDLDFDAASRSLTLSFVAQTVFGEASGEVTV